MVRTFSRFVDLLSRAEVPPRAVNQYARTGAETYENAVRRRNLRLYLEELADRRTAAVLIGEAPSHRGGRLTGIPFVSETMLLSGVETITGRALGADRGYRKATAGPKLSTEASATIVWQTIRDFEPLPLLWNAFPFHPFQEGTPLSNRAPSRAELEIGQPIIERLLRLYQFRMLIAIGNHASMSLEKLGLTHVKVRHPSQGGKPMFVAGLRKLLG